MLDDVAAVFELNEGRLRVIFIAKENLCDFNAITDATFGGTWVSTEANTLVATGQPLAAGPGAGRTIAWLMAQLGAALVRALPSARLMTWNAGLSTGQHALAVDAAVLASLLAWRAAAIARLIALVRADQETLTLVRHMKTPLITHATFAWTFMPAFQLLLARAVT